MKVPGGSPDYGQNQQLREQLTFIYVKIFEFLLER